MNIQQIWDLATKKFKETSARQYNKGFEKYGKALTNFNNRNPFADAREEVVDLHQYLTQAETEFDTLARFVYIFGVTEGFWEALPEALKARVMMVVGDDTIATLCAMENIDFYGVNKWHR